METQSKSNRISPAMHRLFFFGMFALCGAATVFYAKQTLATDTAGTLVNTATTTLTTDKTTSYTAPTSTTTTLKTSPVASSNTTATTPTTSTTSTTDDSKDDTVLTNTTTSTAVKPVTNTVSAVISETAPTQTTTKTTSQTSATTASGTTNTSATSTTTKTSSSDEPIRATIQVTPVAGTSVISTTDQTGTQTSSPAAQAPAPSSEENKTVVVQPAKVILAKDLPQTQNPKTTGAVDQNLKVDKVEMASKNDGSKALTLSGKAQPNSVVTIYIFSNDPTVITIKTDANGNWTYQLDKDVADGQHEAFVAVTDTKGNVVSKSEPIAFVKTAQAATQIPVSELNQSPMQRSAQQYILTALIIMVACLLIALAMIGVLTYKRNPDEGNY